MRSLPKVSLLWFVLSLLPIPCFSQSLEGKIITTDKKIIEAPLILAKEALPIKFLENGVKTTIYMKDVSRLLIVDPRNYSDVDAIIFLTDGRKFSINFNADDFSGDTSSRFLYKQTDPISGKLVTQGISYKEVREVSFDKDTGSVRVDSAGNIFPPDFIFSPYTGEKLKLTQPH